MEHWLEAERLLLGENAEFMEGTHAFEIEIHVAGFVAKEIEVLAMPDTLLVRAETKLMDPNDQPATHVLMRRYDLPEAINPEHTTAHLAKGVLKITAQKMAAPAQAMAHAASA